MGLATLGISTYSLFNQPMLSVSNITPIIKLDKNTSATSFVNLLASQHRINSKTLFLLLIRMQGISAHLKAGIYQIKNGETAMQLLYRVIDGDVLKEHFIIIDGTTRYQIATHLAQAPYLIYNETDWLTVSSTYAGSEGLLLADTYQYNAGAHATDILKQAHENLEKYLQVSWQQRAEGLPYKTSYELLIAASIIEKEAALLTEKRLISGIIVNRLHRGMPLQMDPTVIYALGRAYTGLLTHADLQIDSPYNSYRVRGLPPTPIAMVGRDAINAAAHPDMTNYLYFVARGDGTHFFSRTYDQQKQAIYRYLRH